MKQLIFLFVIGFILLSSCRDSEMYDMLTGTWTCTSWTSEVDDRNQCDDNVYFTFHRDKTYESTIGPTEEEGTYWVNSRHITFHPDEKLKIKVEVIELTEDSLSFYMNNAGTRERMVLRKIEDPGEDK